MSAPQESNDHGLAFVVMPQAGIHREARARNDLMPPDVVRCARRPWRFRPRVSRAAALFPVRVR
jgi:hypothetical protein